MEEGGSSAIPNSINKVKERMPLHISTSQRGLLGQGNPNKGFMKNVFASCRGKMGNSGSSNYSLASPSGKFRQIAKDRDDISRTVPSSTCHGFRERFGIHFNQKMSWDSIKKICQEWIRNPMNMAFFVWIVCVAISGAILFMVMIGMLNHAIPSKRQRNAWFEVNNQILNALFTLMCLYQHPKRLYHFVLLCRWKPDDISRLRKVYCKNGTYKPHEWTNMMVVVALLNLNCFAQYALCSLNLGYKRSRRPPIGVGICVTVAISSAAFAGLYTILSSLGRDYEPEIDQEAQNQTNIRTKTLEKKFSFALRDNQRVVENRPEWVGGLFDLWNDISTAYLSLFCSFCVFGWNMERLGFGNMYVHIATFVLFCTAPFFIFNLAAINVDNEVVQEALGVTGIVLCIFGFLYGGFWRIQMRKRFNLPPNSFCCRNPGLTDCVQWLFCCWCSLAQEVRTVDFYDIVEDKFYKKQGNESEQQPPLLLSPLGREDSSSTQLRLNQGSPIWTSPSKSGAINSSSSPSRFRQGYDSPKVQLPMLVEESLTVGGSSTMTAPPPVLIEKEKSDQPRSMP